MAERMKELPPQTIEQIEAERFQYESNAYAADNPLYAAARSAAVQFLVLPLKDTEPLVEPTKATRDPKRLLAWWKEWPEASPGIALGRAAGVFALRVDDKKAWERLREMAIVERRDADTDKSWKEDRGLGGQLVRLVAPARPISTRAIGGWGRDFDREVQELARESRNRNPQTFFLVYSYPPPSGLDAFEYKTRIIEQGVKLLGDHAVMPWEGAIVDGNRVAVHGSGRPPEPPMWLALTIGKPRSRRVMQAAREGYEAALRLNEAHVIGEAEAQRASTEAARRLAEGDIERAAKALAKAEREAEREEQAS
jgi:hypothetical protein